MTLVVGAGISLPYGIPSWWKLVSRLWEETFPTRPMPDAWTVPQLLPLALDLIARERGTGFSQALKAALYREAKPFQKQALRTGDATLACIARLLVREHALGPRRRITRVVSFNVDDLLEQAAFVLAPRQRALKPVVRASHHPRRGRGEQAIPLYHLHGYLPSSPRAKWHDGAPDTLVFTDLQYWQSVASPLSFANRVMAFALHDSRCIFVGLSMTDLNLLRWLAFRQHELQQDKASQFGAGRGGAPERRSLHQALDRHFWIRPAKDDTTGFVGDCLALRGIRSVDVESWTGPSFSRLIETCFPPDRIAPADATQPG